MWDQGVGSAADRLIIVAGRSVGYEAEGHALEAVPLACIVMEGESDIGKQKTGMAGRVVIDVALWLWLALPPA